MTAPVTSLRSESNFPPLRAWQRAALDQYLAASPRDFLAVATPGAGKTTFALRLAHRLLRDGTVRAITVVCPTEHLKTQWADAALRLGIYLDPAFTNAQELVGGQYHGVAITYAQVAAAPELHRRRTQHVPTLVILDEIHHGGDAKSWGDGMRHAFTPAIRRLALTGTPFRSDDAPIPFVTYELDEDMALRSQADYVYGYGDALREGVVRPVIFLSYSGNMRWRTRSGQEMSAQLGGPATRDVAAHAWRTALDPKGEWIRAVFRAADRRLRGIRVQIPDAGGMVIASNQTQARAYASLLAKISGEKPTVVLSDDAGASQKIEDFANSKKRWLVAVRMVSEGVDIPRLAVGVYATSSATPLFFAQVIGRFVRNRQRGETASVFLPSVPVLLELASTLEKERDHVLNRPDEAIAEIDEADFLAEANREEKVAALEEPGAFAALEARASFDRALFNGTDFAASPANSSEEEQEFLGLPGLLDDDQVLTLLRAKQAAEAKAMRSKTTGSGRLGTRIGAGRGSGGVDPMDPRVRKAARKELASLVSGWAQRSGASHAQVYNELRRTCGGPEVARASVGQLNERIATVRTWFVRR